MANRNQDKYYYGMDAEIQNKIASKWDPVRAATAQAWLEALANVRFEGEFHESLKDGQILCLALNKLAPGSVRKIQTSKMPFKQRENITAFLEGCKKLGMKDFELFVTQDLFEGDNLVAVVDAIFNLGAVARNLSSFGGPYIGVKRAEANKREFTEAQLRAGSARGTGATSGSKQYEAGPQMDKIIRNAEEFEASRGKNVAKAKKPAAARKPAPAPAAPSASASSGPKFCPQCGAKRVGSGKFCSECGNKF